MSKKTRNKSPKRSPAKATRAPSRASAKKPAVKAPRAVVNKSGKNTKKRQAGKTPRAASRAAASKKPKPAVASGSSPRIAAESKAAATRPKAVNPAAIKLSGAKPEASAASKAPLSEGAKAPAFRLPRDGGSTVSLADYSGKKLVLFFYPRADTPGCTREAIDFTRLKGAFADHDTAVLGVSADAPKAQEAFRDKHDLSVPLLSDEPHEMLEAYGVWGEKSMYGRTFQGILRTTVLIGANGRVINIWRHVKVDGHADEVLAAVQAL
jgi:thioredoxin-dependent peroxiredoxin